MQNLNSTTPTLMVDTATLAQATSCAHDFSCLSDGTCSNCKVFACVDDTLLVQCQVEEPCAYRQAVSGRQTCQCPVRKKIFTKYGS